MVSREMAASMCVRSYSRHVREFEEKNGTFGVTQIELDYMIARANGDIPVRGSTQASLLAKIRRATGWTNMSPTQLICRFVYRHGLARL